jgi:SPASM domain peptide maturase of grasp-with-spasm system
MPDTPVFMLFADCVLVRGAARSAIYDLGRNKLVSFSSAYHDLILRLNGRSLEAASADLESDEQRAGLQRLVAWLIANEFGAWTRDATAFPAIRTEWRASSVIHNAIVDVRSVQHDFASLFCELDALGCEFVQIRAYSTLLSIAELDAIAAHAEHRSLRGVEILLPHDPTAYPDAALLNFVVRRRIVSKLIVHSSPEDRVLTVSDDIPDSATRRHVYFIADRISGASHCGQISPRTLSAPSTPLFTELQRHNGCLNGKISIDEQGRIKNCPSMSRSFGALGQTSLSEIAASAQLRSLWKIAKDQIETCRDCEFRYACTDCRAYVRSPGNLLSKPAKCGYDPYTGRWSEGAAQAEATAGYAASTV